MFSDDFDNLPNQFSFLVEDGEGHAMASIRISVVRPDLGWTVAPSPRVFGDDATYEGIYRSSFVEASRLCFVNTARRDVLYRVIANMVAMADLYQTEWLVACPRVEMSPMYQRSFGFRPLAAARQYFGVNFKTDLLGTRREELRRVATKVSSMGGAWQTAMEAIRRSFPPMMAPAMALNS
jgi:hypothetical protein